MKLCIMKLKVRLECILKVFFADDKMVVQSHPSRMKEKSVNSTIILYYHCYVPHSIIPSEYADENDFLFFSQKFPLLAEKIV